MTLAVLAALGLAAAPPNVVVVVADDLGYADVGFRGCRDIPTPHLDRLAAGGVECTAGYVTHPFCSPTRAALLTGRYQQRFGHENNPVFLPNDASVGLPLSQATLADVLKSAGYATGHVGKWHLGAHPTLYPTRRGFDRSFCVLGGGHHYFEHNLFQSNPMRARQEYLSPLLRDGVPVAETEYLTDALAREATAFVAAHKAKPFFLYLAFTAPHTPLQAPPKYQARIADIADDTRRGYAALVCGLDDAVGRLTASLKEHGLDQNTLVVFLSDNGGPTKVTGARNAPFRGEKGQLYEGGVRVPFVVSWPARITPGKQDAPVSALDILPTAAAAAGAKLPAGLTPDGFNLLDAPADRPLFWRVNGGDAHAVRRGSLKLVVKKGEPAELYDLAADPGETADLAAARPRDVELLEKELAAWDKQLVKPLWGPLPRAKK